MARQFTLSSLILSTQTYENFAGQRHNFSAPEQSSLLMVIILQLYRSA